MTQWDLRTCPTGSKVSNDPSVWNFSIGAWLWRYQHPWFFNWCATGSRKVFHILLNVACRASQPATSQRECYKHVYKEVLSHLELEKLDTIPVPGGSLLMPGGRIWGYIRAASELPDVKETVESESKELRERMWGCEEYSHLKNVQWISSIRFLIWYTLCEEWNLSFRLKHEW